MSEWQPIETAPIEARIRVIGGSSTLRVVVGDVFFGPASMLLHRLHDADYVAERSEPTWRYTQGEDRIEEHLRPTHWMPLPAPPKGTP